MSRDKAETIAYAIRKECQRSSLYDWCESWDITIDEFEVLHLRFLIDASEGLIKGLSNLLSLTSIVTSSESKEIDSIGINESSFI